MSREKKCERNKSTNYKKNLFVFIFHLLIAVCSDVNYSHLRSLKHEIENRIQLR